MKGKTTLFLILLVAIIPPVAATLLFFYHPPIEQTNHGDLMSPVAMPTEEWQNHDGGDFSDEELRGKWVLWQAAAGACNTHCRRRLCRMRQLRLMLPGNYFRLRRGWLLTDGQEPPNALTQGGDCGEVRAAGLQDVAQTVDVLNGVLLWRGDSKILPAAARPPEDYLYLTDPAGRMVMRFPPEVTIYEIRTDLKRLLKLSKGWRQVK